MKWVSPVSKSGAIILALLAFAPRISQGGPACAQVFSDPPPSASTAKPHIIVISAPSGGGKTTLARLLLKDFPNLDISVSSTTRAPRGTEVDGVDYHFLSVKDFKAKVAQGKFAEWADVHGNLYGTDVDNLKRALSKGHSVLALIDVEGAAKIKKTFPDDTYTIFLSPPDMATLETRLRGRGTDSEAAIQQRLKNAQGEIARSKDYQKIVVNDDLDRAHSELLKLLRDLKLVP